MAVLRIEALAVDGDGLDLRDLTLSVSAGEVVAIAGPSGAGKSLMLRTLAGLVPVSGGRIRLGEGEITRLGPDARRRAGLGYVPQGLGLGRTLSVRETLGLAAVGRRGWRRAAAGFDWMAARPRERVDELTDAERVELALARALAAAPKVLLFDDFPSEAALRERVAPRLARLAAGGLGVLMTLRDPDAALPLLDRIAWLDRGRGAGSHPAETLRRRPSRPR